VFLFEYLPLHPKEATARVTLTSQELGTYTYDLKLAAVACGPEKPLHFKVGLGGSQMQTFRFLSYAKQRTEFICKIDNPEFFVEKVMTAVAGMFINTATSGGVEVAVDVTYEPSRLGDVRTNLVITSTIGGDYLCPLQGHCIAPRPQGPIILKAGTPTMVSFKNVFNTNSLFVFVVDNPAFVAKASETIASKKTIQLSISYKQGGIAQTDNKTKAQTPSSRTGKLTITNQNTNIVWTFYLKYLPN
jgi:hypothetical protein